jgi:hypothetical protein
MYPVREAVRLIGEQTICTPTDLEILNRSITSLVTSRFQEVLSCAELDQLRVNLSKLVRSVTCETRVAVIGLMQSLEHKYLPPELTCHQAFQGTPIQKGMELAHDALRERNIPFQLSDFVRSYCDFVFDTIDPDKSEKLFLIRPCSSIPSSPDCNYFVLTMRKKKDHSLHYLCSVDKEGWHIVDKKRKRGQDFDSLDHLLQLVVSNGYMPVAPLGEKKYGKYFTMYAAQQLEGDEAKEMIQSDPILDLLTDAIDHGRLRCPMISPEGHTYSRDNIVAWVRVKPTDPITRTPLYEHQLIPNQLCARLVQARLDSLQGNLQRISSLENWRQDPILSLFEDSRTHKLMRDPVISLDGFSHERTSAHEISNRVALAVLNLRIKQIEGTQCL